LFLVDFGQDASVSFLIRLHKSMRQIIKAEIDD
jgi:hypothetical protein